MANATSEKKQPLTQMVWVKKLFTDEQKIELGKQMADAEERLSAKSEELDAEADAFKETKKRLEGEMSGIQTELHDHAKMFRQGYNEVQVDCFVTYYDDKMVRFTDKVTGEVVEEREMTEAEQLRLSGKMVDAEQVIREASKED